MEPYGVVEYQWEEKKEWGDKKTPLNETQDGECGKEEFRNKGIVGRIMDKLKKKGEK